MSLSDEELFKQTNKTLTIEFDTIKQAQHFKSWLFEVGEQDYYRWMECRLKQYEAVDDDVVIFDFHSGKNMINAYWRPEDDYDEEGTEEY